MLITLDCMTTLERGWGMLADRIVPFPPRERTAAIQGAVSCVGFPREA